MSGRIQPVSDSYPEIEKALGLSEGQLARLDSADDWTFVLQIAALAEIAVTHLIEAELKHPGLEEYLERLSLGGQFGKRALAESLGVISVREAKAIDALQRVRAAYAHNLSAMGLKLDDYLMSLPEGQRRSVIESIAAAMPPTASYERHP